MQRHAMCIISTVLSFTSAMAAKFAIFGVIMGVVVSVSVFPIEGVDVDYVNFLYETLSSEVEDYSNNHQREVPERESFPVEYVLNDDQVGSNNTSTTEKQNVTLSQKPTVTTKKSIANETITMKPTSGVTNQVSNQTVTKSAAIRNFTSLVFTLKPTTKKIIVNKFTAYSDIISFEENTFGPDDVTSAVTPNMSSVNTLQFTASNSSFDSFLFNTTVVNSDFNISGPFAPSTAATEDNYNYTGVL